MPPVREASTKPSAATVLPAPVACSNQKRLRGVGVLGLLGELTSSSLAAVVPVQRLLGLVVVLVAPPRPGCRRGPARPGPRRPTPLPLPVAVALRLGEQRGQRARQRVDLMGARAPCRRPASARPGRAAARGPSSSENVRRQSTEGTLSPASISASAASSATPPRRAGRERDRDVLALGDEGLARELRGPLEVSGSGRRAWPDRPLAWIQPRKARRFGKERPPRWTATIGETLAGSTSSGNRERLRRPSESVTRECAPLKQPDRRHRRYGTLDGDETGPDAARRRRARAPCCHRADAGGRARTRRRHTASGRRLRPRAGPARRWRARPRRSPRCTSSPTSSSTAAQARSTHGSRELRGHPVVINKWASWCGPCRAEFPIFQQVATERGKRDRLRRPQRAATSAPPPSASCAQYPVPYPSYDDPGEDIARALKAPSNFPDHAVHRRRRARPSSSIQGGYRSAADLNADIDEVPRWT